MLDKYGQEVVTLVKKQEDDEDLTKERQRRALNDLRS